MTRVQTVGVGAGGRGAVGGVGRSTSRAVCRLRMVPEGPSGVCVVMVTELCGQAGRGSALAAGIARGVGVEGGGGRTKGC